jgi:hypothetical protein
MAAGNFDGFHDFRPFFMISGRLFRRYLAVFL